MNWDVSNKMKKNSLIRVGSLHCTDCVKKIENRVGKMKGVYDLNLSFATGMLNVTHDSKQVTVQELIQKVKELGYDVFETELAKEKLVSIHNLKLILTIISGIFFTFGLLITFFRIEFQFVVLSYNLYLSELLFILAMVLAGYYIFKEAIIELLEKEFAIELLMVIAAIGAVLIGALPEAVAILFLFSIAELLESYATDRNRRSINELISLSPKTVLIKHGSKTVKTSVDAVKPGEIAVVRSGQFIGIDGTIMEGRSAVNQASITGEAMPVRRGPGDKVYAGTLNHEGRLEIRITKYAKDTTLAKIIKLIETAEEKKSKTERFMDKFAKYYTPSILLLAFIVVLVPTFVFNQPFNVWFYKALMLILISCPCALAISTPVSIVSAITNGARKGVLFKGGVYVEQAARVNTVAFDKTGTLTWGKPQVVDIIPLNGSSKNELLHIASSLECLSKHPLGDALVECAEENGLHTECVEEFTTIVGKGVKGRVDGVEYYVGDDTLFNKPALDQIKKYLDKFESEAKTIVLIGEKNKIFGIITFADQMRASGKKMVDELHKMGVKRTVMLTGDNENVATELAAKLGIT